MNAPETSAPQRLPNPKLQRWQPLRSGLINLYHYADEQFWFEDGRMLLRGNNGTGKSRVLALQLPFLLDGELAPHRMEPDRSRSKRPEWNLLLGGKHRDRLGYSWLEFGRLDHDGQPHYLTLGCGLHAVEHRSSMDRWYFITPARIGTDLHLVHESVPLSRGRLNEALQATAAGGHLYTTVEEYRRAVDEQLFRLGRRYRPLLDLLIQLRMPQLSRDLDEQKMSEQLSGALPPLPTDILTQVAEAMSDLDDQRRELKTLRDCHQHVQSYRAHYCRYLQQGLHRRAADVTQGHSEYEKVQRAINAQQRQLQETTQQLNDAESKRQEARTRRDWLRATIDTLRGSPEMQDAQRLDEARRTARNAKEFAEQQRSAAQRATTRVDDSAKELEKRHQRADSESAKTQAHVASLHSLDVSEDLRHALVEQLTDIHLNESYGPNLKSVHDAHHRQVQAVDCLLQHQREMVKLQHELDRQQDRLYAAELRCEQQRERVTANHESLHESQHALIESVMQWRQSCEQLEQYVPSAETIRERLAADEDGSFPGVQQLAPLIREAADTLAEQLTAQREQAQQNRAQRIADHDELLREREQLDAGVHQPPPVPYTRDPVARQDRPGIPLYQACDFVDTVPETERPMWEAALEASGLLDAWITSDGRLVDPHKHDTMIVARQPLTDATRRLSNVLKPADAADVPTEAVAHVLNCVGVGEDAGDVWVANSGRWQVGVLTGCWSKDSIEHIGQAARERRRLQRIAQIDQAVSELLDQIREWDQSLAILQARRESLRRELESLPNDQALRDAIVKYEQSQLQLVEFDREYRVALQQVGEAKSALLERQQRRDSDAADLRLSDWVNRLDALKQNLYECLAELDRLGHALERLVECRIAVADAQSRLKAATEDLHLARQAADTADREAQAADARANVLEQNVGAAVETIVAKITEAEAEEKLKEELLEQLNLELRKLDNVQGQVNGKLEELNHTLTIREDARGDFIARLAHLANEGLVNEAFDGQLDVPMQPWAATKAVVFARAIHEAIGSSPLSDEKWEETQNRALARQTQLEQSLIPEGYTPQFRSLEDLTVTTIPFRGQANSVTQVCDALADEVRHRETLLTQRERQLFEERLIGDIAESLHTSIRDAHRLVQGMNDEVIKRPMSSGMRLKFHWRTADNGAEGLAAACKALMARPVAMSPEEREALGRFLQARIADVRAREDGSSWQEHLEQALDYRRWYVFDILRQTDADRAWERLTRRTHGTGSGGERAVALIVPMLAALAAYYTSADDVAPRIILMDEAFVGIDSTMRSKCMELLVKFDLDFVMTSEREWGCYPTVPSLAIYHLSTRTGVDAILSTRWIWNGQEKKHIPAITTQSATDAHDSSDSDRTQWLLS